MGIRRNTGVFERLGIFLEQAPLSPYLDPAHRKCINGYALGMQRRSQTIHELALAGVDQAGAVLLGRGWTEALKVTRVLRNQGVSS